MQQNIEVTGENLLAEATSCTNDPITQGQTTRTLSSHPCMVRPQIYGQELADCATSPS